MSLVKTIEDWIQSTNLKYLSQRQSCEQLAEAFTGYYSPGFLKTAYFVVMQTCPKPDLPQLRERGFGEFLDMPVDGITYDNTYYIRNERQDCKGLHFHELVHVVQWKQLGAPCFIQRYMQELLKYGYRDAPLEKMAFQLEAHFENKSGKLDVHEWVRNSL